MRSIPSEIKYVYPPVTYADGRRSIIEIPDGYVQEALSDVDMGDLASEFGLELAVVKAVMQVESAGSGFLLREPSPSRPKILFEAAWFYTLTPQPVSRTRPDLSSPTWDSSLYKGGSAEWGRLFDAMEFDEIQALKSASFGLGQVMGFNYPAAGCNSVKEFVRENFAGEYWQGRHMMNFIKNNGLIGALNSHDWIRFARGYNGEGEAANNYHNKLATAYHNFA